ncbi:MAG: succinate dehydrogenase, hydrophobic membrane anchor protein [Candidatus Eisenbacteria bacterium]
MQDRGIRSGGVLPWFFQRLTGLLLAPILLVHLFTMHRYHEHGLAFENVTRLLANPYWKVLEIVFLVAALYHALVGVHFILQDYIRRPGLRLTAFSLIVLAGVTLLVFGLITVLSVRAPGMAETIGAVPSH